MNKLYDKHKLSFFETINLCMKGRKDGKKGKFKRRNDILVSSFMEEEMVTYNNICLKVKEEYMEEFSKNMQIAKKEIDEMEMDLVEYAQMRAQMKNRRKMLDESHDQEELLDLDARIEQLNIAENAMKTMHRNIVRESISVMELLLRNYDDTISLVKSYYYQRQMKYLKYVEKYFTDITTDFIKIEHICNVCGIKEPFEDDRKLIANYKATIGYDTEYVDSQKGDS